MPDVYAGQTDRGERYQLVQRIGVGTFGEVWRGLDCALGTPVAIKIVRRKDEIDDELYRRETVAMRQARVPGVVRLLDDSTERPPSAGSVGPAAGPKRGTAWLIMELVHGEPFGTVHKSWELLRPALVSLLGTIARLHFKGLIHQDLKPTNVLVHRGHAVVLDLGIARGGAMLWLEPQEGFEGSPAYSPPEQRRLRAPLTSRVDIYAVGAMVYEALTGALPYTPKAGESAFSTAVTEPPVPSIALLRPDLPAVVKALVDAMLDADPARRPSAVEALLALGEPPPLVPASRIRGLGSPIPMHALQALFHGPEAFQHLPSDAALALFDRTGGRPDAVLAELNACISAGIGSWENGAVRVERVDIERMRTTDPLRQPTRWEGNEEDQRLLTAIDLLHPNATPPRLAAVLDRMEAEVVARAERLGAWRTSNGGLAADRIADRTLRPSLLSAALEALPRPCAKRVILLAELGSPKAEVIEEVMALAEAGADLGAAEGVLGLQQQALDLAHETDDDELERRVFAWVTRSAIEAQSAAQWDRVEGLLGQARFVVDDAAAMGRLARVYKLRAVGDRSAYDHWQAVPPLDDPRLEASRLSVGVLVHRDRGAAALTAWIQSAPAFQTEAPEGRLPLALARAHLAYLAGHYTESAAQYRVAATSAATEPQRLSAKVNELGSLLDAGAFTDILRIAPALLARAEAQRDAQMAARFSYLLRAARYREGGDSEGVDPDLTRAAAEVNTTLAGFHSLVDCGIAFRAQDHALTATLAERGRRWAILGASPPVALIFSCLLAAVGAPPGIEPALLQERAANPRMPWGLRLQCIAMLARGGLAADLAPAFELAWSEARFFTRRLELFSPDECREMFDRARS